MIENIEVLGLKKIAIGTLFSYLPVKAGETFDSEQTPAVIRELFSTGFFNDIKLARRDNVLIITVAERPSIAEVNFEGNNDIDDAALEQALDSVGMSKGRIFDQHKLARLELELQEVYYSLGKYAARIEAKSRAIDQDRIAIDINISEGVSARINSINLAGNRAFSEEQLLDILELEASGDAWFASDEYSSAKLNADLEALRSFYLDRGFLQFQVESKQVTISPDRKDISISISLSEGVRYTLSGIEIGGEMVVPEAKLRALISLRDGDTFSRKAINRVTKAMQNLLAESGYAYAAIRIANGIDQKTNSVSLKFLLEPGNRMRVRYIQFVGNDRTKDTVLRREMRQLEADLYQQSKIDRSRVRLQRLNYIASVNIALQKIPGLDDQLDLKVSVTERFSGNLSAGLGYSQAQGALLNLGFSHDNIFGSGNEIEFTFDNSAASERYSFGYINPYYTPEGVSRGFKFAYTETDAAENNTSNYLLDRIELSVNYGIPLTEYNSLRLELGFLRTSLETTIGSADEVYDFVIENNSIFAGAASPDIISDEYDDAFASLRFAKDTRNRRIFADTGHLNSIDFEWRTGDLDFYKVRYFHQSAFPVSDTVIFNLKGRLGYGASYGETNNLPIFEKFTAGGVRSLRGYEFNSLGPKDSSGDAFGGNLQLISTAEILFPVESLGSSETFRLGVYFDIGNVFAELDDYDASELRQSFGLSAKWFSVVGPIEFSYAYPLNDQPGDELQELQFSLGARF